MAESEPGKLIENPIEGNLGPGLVAVFAGFDQLFSFAKCPIGDNHDDAPARPRWDRNQCMMLDVSTWTAKVFNDFAQQGRLEGRILRNFRRGFREKCVCRARAPLNVMVRTSEERLSADLRHGD